MNKKEVVMVVVTVPKQIKTIRKEGRKEVRSEPS